MMPRWRAKHPCTGCGTGYGECLGGLMSGLTCCKDCDHPTRWAPDPYTAEDYEEMKQG